MEGWGLRIKKKKYLWIIFRTPAYLELGKFPMIWLEIKIKIRLTTNTITIYTNKTIMEWKRQLRQTLVATLCWCRPLHKDLWPLALKVVSMQIVLIRLRFLPPLLLLPLELSRCLVREVTLVYLKLLNYIKSTVLIRLYCSKCLLFTTANSVYGQTIWQQMLSL